jgi:hypothetical protein
MGNALATSTRLSKQDIAALNDLFGRALLYDDVGHALLHREERRQILEGYSLSFGTVHCMMSFSDMPDISRFALEVYNTILAP